MVQITENPLILVDGSSYLYRAYYVLPLLTNSAGEPTGAMYGVLNMLKSLLIKYQPSHVAVIFDTKGKTFRDELFEHYKSRRPPMPDDLCNQIKPLYNMIKAMGLPLLAINGVEADDVIGTLAQSAERNGRDVLISTGDKDMAQMVSPHITLINTMSNIIFGPEEVQLKFGVPPQLIIDYLALIGDNSDNIPGIPGIGKKTAQVLLQNFGGLKNLYKQLDNISTLRFRGAKTMAAKLAQHRELAFLSYKLAKIKTDVELDLSYDELMVQKLESKTLMILFQRYEFKRWIRDLEAGKWLQNSKSAVALPSPFTAPRRFTAQEEPINPSSKNNYFIINKIKTLEKWIALIRSTGVFAVNTETDGLNTLTANLVGLCFAIRSGEIAYLPMGHNYLDTSNQLDRAVALAMLKPVLEDPSISKIGQNLKFDLKVLNRYGIKLSGIIFDTMLESYVLNSSAGRHDIDSLIDRFLQFTTVNFGEIAGKKRTKLTFNQIAFKTNDPYATKNANTILRLHQKLWPLIKQASELKKIFEEIEMPLVPVLSRIEHTGVLIDENILTVHSIEISKRLEALKQKAHQLAKEPFNLSSTKQIQTIFYDKQKLPVLKKTPRGTPSTNEEVLAKLALDYPLPKLILEYRSLAKLKSTYTDKLPQMINPVSKRIHTSYNQAITVTGRLSSSDPNLQNIPVRTDEGRRIRQAFIAPPNSFIVTADYSQIELRIMAHLSRDPGLLNAFAESKDIHCVTAAEIFGMPLDKVTQDQRRRAKTINFGLIYGMSAFGLARQLSIKHSEAQQYMNFYFKRYPSILKYMRETRRQAIEKGYVTTLNGRRLYLKNIYSRNGTRNKSADRAAINAPMQGTAADIIKRAMIAIDSWLQHEAPRVRMIMQVHDELIFEVQQDVVEINTTKIKSLMEGCSMLDVPMQVDIGIGTNWDEAHSK
ncbi:DNA polymerase I [Sodalis endosymbiont of Henestaris halophilus]|uniref:DNA polymerase I n=1 Tax=Sodalis endosymbiont of Henestaris halophilus TaxID=1929246 RepID=UPI000BC0BE5B|nr:DNA polymerase I [Sodalis endosymbiont of Henestaris halophilus]SNC58406.1 DNA polymerase I [Sodalis endosymbiont of Henestaris halophilus]